MEHCENCKWFGGYIHKRELVVQSYLCNEFNIIYNFVKRTCVDYERKTMNIKDCYKLMQAEWVKLYNVEVGDTVKVLRCGKKAELGFSSYFTPGMFELIGSKAKVVWFDTCCITLRFSEHTYYAFPFFCLEFVKKAEPVIEITVTVNHKEVPLNTLSKETLLRIRDKT